MRSVTDGERSSPHREPRAEGRPMAAGSLAEMVGGVLCLGVRVYLEGARVTWHKSAGGCKTCVCAG